MSSAIKTERGGTCGICQEKFSIHDQQFTHAGGEGHDGFHRSCFIRWLKFSSTCPYDRQAINPGSLISRTESIMERIGPELAAYTVSFGMITGAVAGAVRGAVRGAGVRVGAIAGAGAGAIIGTVAGIGINRILNQRAVDHLSHENIGFGMQAREAAAALLTSLVELPPIALVGIAEGIAEACL